MGHVLDATPSYNHSFVDPTPQTKVTKHKHEAPLPIARPKPIELVSGPRVRPRWGSTNSDRAAHHLNIFLLKQTHSYKHTKTEKNLSKSNPYSKLAPFARSCRYPPSVQSPAIFPADLHRNLHRSPITDPAVMRASCGSFSRQVRFTKISVFLCTQSSRARVLFSFLSILSLFGCFENERLSFS